MLARRQIEPAALHALPLEQRPKVAPAALLQTTFVICPIPPPPEIFVEPGEPAAPQQSESVWQISPVGRHPLGGWQISTPVAANGRHDRLQHAPPQVGSGPPV